MRALLAVLIVSVCFSFSSAYAAQSNEMIIDRMLLSVGQKNYSQRQFEIYQLVKSTILGKTIPLANQVVNPADWKSGLENFRNEMILRGAAERESFENQNLQLAKHTVDAALKLFNKNIAKQEASKTWLERYKVSANELRSAVSDMLLVQAYLRRKNSLVNTPKERFWGYKVDDATSWFKRLKDQTPYRFYEGALNYQPLAVLP